MRNIRKQNYPILATFVTVMKIFNSGMGLVCVQFIFKRRFITLIRISRIEKPVTYIKMILVYYIFLLRNLSPPGICFRK